MRKQLLHIFLPAVLILFSGLLFAQRPERCATVNYNKMREQENPELVGLREKGREMISRLVAERNFKTSQTIITIPVVVHVLYRTNLENIPDGQIHSQIAVLNEDYGRTNADAAQTPSAFVSVASNTQIQFCLATRTPNGDPTTGIERRQTTNMDWMPDDNMKFYNTGGLNAWDPFNYLNIWVCNLASGFLGYSTDPQSVNLNPSIDGVVIRSRSFGRQDFVYPPYDKGRTATHEVGHWLGLYHIWGDDGGSCLGTDAIDDTPNQADFTTGCPSFPLYDACSYIGCPLDTSNPCSTDGIMFMNYMDYTDDACMNTFTQGQAAYMQAAINAYRSSLYSSQGCVPVGVGEIFSGKNISVYPNPASCEISVECPGNGSEQLSLSVCDVTGKEILRQDEFYCEENIPVDISSVIPGVYFLKLKGQHLFAASRFVVIR